MKNKVDIEEISLQKLECLKCQASGVQCDHQREQISEKEICSAVEFN